MFCLCGVVIQCVFKASTFSKSMQTGLEPGQVISFKNRCKGNKYFWNMQILAG